MLFLLPVIGFGLAMFGCTSVNVVNFLECDHKKASSKPLTGAHDDDVGSALPLLPSSVSPRGVSEAGSGWV